MNFKILKTSLIEILAVTMVTLKINGDIENPAIRNLLLASAFAPNPAKTELSHLDGKLMVLGGIFCNDFPEALRRDMIQTAFANKELIYLLKTVPQVPNAGRPAPTWESIAQDKEDQRAFEEELGILDKMLPYQNNLEPLKENNNELNQSEKTDDTGS